MCHTPVIKATQEAEAADHKRKACLGYTLRQATTYFKTKRKKKGWWRWLIPRSRVKLDTVVCVYDVSVSKGNWEPEAVASLLEPCGSAILIPTVVNNNRERHLRISS